MIDLKLIIKQYHNCLGNKSSFKSVLMDIYPDEKRTINILTIMLECGIVQKIKNKSVLEDNDFCALLTSLENDYGISPQYSVDSLKLWADAYDVKVQTTISEVSFSINSESIEEAPIVENVIIKGCESDYEIEVMESGSLKIKKFIGFDEKEMTIPNQIDGRAVTVIGKDAFADCNKIEKLNISEGITAIENGAFYCCKSLKIVSLPTTLKKLGNEPKIIISSVKSSILWDSSKIECKGVFQKTAIKSIVLPKELIFLGSNTFRSCDQLTDINIPNGIKAISKGCFYACESLKTIDIPPSCKVIESSAFYFCINLKQVTLHEGLEKIDYKAFDECEKLRSICIPKSVKEIGKNVFNRCGNFTIFCYAGSYGLKYARENRFQIQNVAK